MEGHDFFASFDFVGGSMKELCIELTGFLGHFVTIVPEETQVPWAKRNRCFQYSISVHPTTIASEAYLGAEKDWGIYSKSLAHITKLIEAGQVKVPSYEVVGELSAQTVETAHALLESRRGRGKLVMQVSTLD